MQKCNNVLITAECAMYSITLEKLQCSNHAKKSKTQHGECFLSTKCDITSFFRNVSISLLCSMSFSSNAAIFFLRSSSARSRRFVRRFWFTSKTVLRLSGQWNTVLFSLMSSTSTYTHTDDHRQMKETTIFNSHCLMAYVWNMQKRQKIWMHDKCIPYHM